MADPDKSPFDFLHEADEAQAAATPGSTDESKEKKDGDFSFFDELAATEPAEGPIGPVDEVAVTPAAEPPAAAADHEVFEFETESKAEEFGVAPSPDGDSPAADSPFAFAPNDPAPTMNFVSDAPDALNPPGDEYGLAPSGPSEPAFADGPSSEAAEGAVEVAAVGVTAFAVAAAFDAPAEPPPPVETSPIEEPLPPDPEIAETQPTPAPLVEDDPQMQTYAKLCGHIRQASQLAAIEAVLDWDERCMMPVAGAESRAEQITLLSGIIHDRLTDPRIGEWLDELKSGPLNQDPHDDFGATLHRLRRQYDKRTKLPKSLVEELAHTAALGQHVWQEARAKDDFASFAPILTKMVGLKQQQADALGYAETRYDALLDDFEPGELTSRVTQVLGALRDELVPLVAQVREGGRTPDLDVLQRRYPIETQRSFGRAAAAKIGFDFERGRLDVTAHPFCTGLGPNDCRITTRYDEHFFNAGFFGILHEAGHGIYDQGLRSEQYGLPMGEAVSMGIHESQSRLWEILVGRSLPFWKNTYSSARAAFPEALRDVTLGRFYFAVNDVRPSLIRVEADEFTYNLHILIRFELEQALISGDLAVADLPGAWREKYRQYLGIDCPNDADGVLQDIHWSAGLFGYFPSYSLGNLYASQFFEAADKELGALERRIEKGQFDLLKKWLTHKIHRQGQRYSASELCERVTGQPLSHEPLMRHLREKYDLLYNPAAAPIDDLDVAPLETEAGVGSMDAGVGVMEPPAGEGYGVAAPETAADDFAAGGFGGATTAPIRAPVYKKKQGGMLTAVIMLVGIVGGGIIGTSLGYWILLWLKGPQGDFLKIREKLPEWVLPAYTEPEQPTSHLPAGLEDLTAVRSDAVSRRLTQRVLAVAARTCG